MTTAVTMGTGNRDFVLGLAKLASHEFSSMSKKRKGGPSATYGPQCAALFEEKMTGHLSSPEYIPLV